MTHEERQKLIRKPFPIVQRVPSKQWAGLTRKHSRDVEIDELGKLKQNVPFDVWERSAEE